MSEQKPDYVGRYYAKVAPRVDGRWDVEVWDGDPFWAHSAGRFPAGVADRLSLLSRDVERVVRSERKARKVAARMVARCEKRHAAKYDREPFEVRYRPEKSGADR